MICIKHVAFLSILFNYDTFFFHIDIPLRHTWKMKEKCRQVVFSFGLAQSDCKSKKICSCASDTRTHYACILWRAFVVRIPRTHISLLLRVIFVSFFVQSRIFFLNTLFLQHFFAATDFLKNYCRS